eukprot:9818381-Alexandrium_andersonii.AAC.1
MSTLRSASGECRGGHRASTPARRGICAGRVAQLGAGGAGPGGVRRSARVGICWRRAGRRGESPHGY